MSTNRRSAPDALRASGRVLGADLEGVKAGPHLRTQHDAGAQRVDADIGGAGSSRRKRRRQRSQQGKRGQHGRAKAQHADVGNRERIFQSVEGLLRQIREQAEEFGTLTEEQLREVAQTVTAFTKSLEDEGDPVSERALSEYQRIREKLSQALRGMEEGAAAAASRV